MTGGDGRLAGAVAVVTGGAGGIGGACAERLRHEGARVVVADLDGEPPVDVTDPTSCHALAQHVDGAYGRLDIVVLAAGTALAHPSPLLEAPLSEWHGVLDVNLTGCLLPLRSLVPLLHDGGSIVIITSGEHQHATPGAGAYCVSKAGAWMLTKVLSLELADRRIRVNAVAPGFVETPMTHSFLAVPDRRERVEERTPLGRIGAPSDVAAAVAYLSSSDASFVTGTTLWVDGGLAVGER